MAGEFGWSFLLFTLVFYGFIGFILFGLNAYNSLVFQLPGYSQTNYTASYGSNFTIFGFDSGIPNPLASLFLILSNPFSAIGFISWLSVAFAVVDLFIIIAGLIP
jgi:hypothetical protein